MLFFKYICDYMLGIIPISQLINAAINSVSNGIESDNLYILAGLNENDEYNISLYYKLALEEFNLKEPTEVEAAKYLIKYYCEELINNDITPDFFLEKIVQIEHKTNTNDRSEGYIGSFLGIELFYGIYYEIGDIRRYKRRNIDEEIKEIEEWCRARYGENNEVNIDKLIEGLYESTFGVSDKNKIKEYTEELYRSYYGVTDKNNVEKNIEERYKLCYKEAEKYLKNNTQ